MLKGFISRSTSRIAFTLLTFSLAQFSYGNWFSQDVRIPMQHDAVGDQITEIDSRIYLQETLDFTERFPAIILVPGWAGTKDDLVDAAENFANRGFNVLTYSPRGFGESGGLTSVGGLNDSKDFSELFKWLIASDSNGYINTHTDPERIGTGFISYGALIPMNGLIFENRIAAIAFIDGPASMLDSFYAGGSANAIWPSFLETRGQQEAENGLPDEIPFLLESLESYSNIETVTNWALDRSIYDLLPEYSHINYKAAIIKNTCAPIFISNNYRDRMFRPNSMIDLFTALQAEDFTISSVETPENPPAEIPEQNNNCGSQRESILQLHDGIHGFTPSDTLRMQTYYDWFAYHLQGEENSIATMPKVSMQLHGTNDRVEYDRWPIPERIQPNQFYIHPTRMSGREGDLLTEPSNEEKDVRLNSSASGHEDVNPSTGLAIIEAQQDVVRDINKFQFSRHAFYTSSKLSKPLKLRGAATLDMTLKLPPGNSQLVAYLYEVADSGKARFITHGSATFLDATDAQEQEVSIEFNAIAYDFKPGTRWAVAMDTYDYQFKKPTNNSYTLYFSFSAERQAVLTLPLDVYEPPAVEPEPEPVEDETSDSSQSRAVSSSGGGPDSGSFGWSLLLLAVVGSISRLNQSRRIRQPN